MLLSSLSRKAYVFAKRRENVWLAARRKTENIIHAPHASHTLHLNASRRVGGGGGVISMAANNGMANAFTRTLLALWRRGGDIAACRAGIVKSVASCARLPRGRAVKQSEISGVGDGRVTLLASFSFCTLVFVFAARSLAGSGGTITRTVAISVGMKAAAAWRKRAASKRGQRMT